MSRKLPRQAPDGAPLSRFPYTVPFFDTDAMGIVHHANYVRYLELGRVQYLRDHDRPYTDYLKLGFHVAVVGVQTEYIRSTRFADSLSIVCWLSWVRTASMGFGYLIMRGEELVLTGRTDHAVVNDAGRPVRIPAELQASLARNCSATRP